MDYHKTLAAIFFRVLGVSYIVFAILYWPYNLLITHYTAPPVQFITPTLFALVYIAAGLILFRLSKRLAGIVVKGLDAT